MDFCLGIFFVFFNALSPVSPEGEKPVCIAGV